VRKKAIGLGATAWLALMSPLGPAGATSAIARDSNAEFRLLNFGGHYVKWGSHGLGSGATVRYAFVTEAMRFNNARNCANVVPIDALTTRSSIPLAAMQEETAAAFRTWEEVADIEFIPTDDPSEADILIGAQAFPVGRAFANVVYRSPSENGVKLLERAVICLNPTHRWKIGFDGDTEVYDLRYTLVHEIGHAIGLDHPNPSGQVMSFRYNELHTDLQPGDLRGVAVLYGDRVRTIVADNVEAAPDGSGSGIVHIEHTLPD
jgi:predicted Zn-dependent protease